MVEKTGHKVTMHKQRVDWINEGKPKAPEESGPAEDLNLSSPKPPAKMAPIFNKRSSERLQTPMQDDLFGDDDIYGATPRTDQQGNKPADEPDEDELAELLAGGEPDLPAWSRDTLTTPAGGVSAASLPGVPPPTTGPSNGARDDDLDALIAEAEASEPKIAEASSNSIFGNGRLRQADTDTGKAEQVDLDALIAEAEEQPAPPRKPVQSKPSEGTRVEPSADEEEAMAEMDGLW